MSNPITIPVDNDNYEQKLAYDLVANTNRCLFITGKAGTGKTTFIQRTYSGPYPFTFEGNFLA